MVGCSSGVWVLADMHVSVGSWEQEDVLLGTGIMGTGGCTTRNWDHGNRRMCYWELGSWEWENVLLGN